MAHVVAVDEVDGAVLARADHLVRMCSALVREQEHAPGSEIEIPGCRGSIARSGRSSPGRFRWSRA